jgi:type III secretory pathway component EscT
MCILLLLLGYLIHEFEQQDEKELNNTTISSSENPKMDTAHTAIITSLHQFRSIIHWDHDQVPSSFDSLYKSLEWLELVESVSNSR